MSLIILSLQALSHFSLPYHRQVLHLLLGILFSFILYHVHPNEFNSSSNLNFTTSLPPILFKLAKSFIFLPYL